MLTRRLKPKEVAAEMDCCVATARARMRQTMVHTEKPLTVTEDELKRWWNKKSLEPLKKAKKTTRTYCRHMQPEENEKFLISRKRPRRE